MKRYLILIGLMCAPSGAASAQTQTPPEAIAPPSASRGGDCASRRENGSNSTTTGQSGEALADKLAKSDGVLCPPTGVDPEIRAPAPNVGKMPVIPPPGSPGGDPTVRPK